MNDDIQCQLVNEETKEYLVTDGKGNSARYFIHKGLKYHSKDMGIHEPLVDKLDEIAKLHSRDNDILLMTYPKSGTHWLANIVSMISRGNTEYVGTPPTLEQINVEYVKSLPSPRILMTHLPFKHIPDDQKSNQSKIITIYRNPKDVMVSYYIFTRKLNDCIKWYKGSWDGYVKFYLSKHIVYGTWFDHIKMWKPALKEYPEKQVLFLSYEDMKMNLYENLLKIGKFLGAERNEEFYRTVEHRCTFANMKEKVNEGRPFNQTWAYACENGILPIYRKGEIGDWKNWFSVSQNEEFDALYEREMLYSDTSDVYTPFWG